jgi:hypothetical protein
MAFSENIDNIVKESRAYENDFFANCSDPSKPFHIYDAVRLAVNWYLVTKHFGLTAPEYTGLLARKLKYSNGRESKSLRRLLVESAKISSDDLGIGNEGLYAENGGSEIPIWDRIHYKLWGDMTKSLIKGAQKITWQDPFSDDGTDSIYFVNSGRDIKKFCGDVDDLNILNTSGQVDITCIPSSYTERLVERIEDEFISLDGGVAVYQTVESIAYNIVVAYSDLMKRINEKVEDLGHEHIFTERDLVYLEIHKPLERDHDAQSTSMVDLLDTYLSYHHRPVIETKVRDLSRLFGEFWGDMNHIVFKN